jgi:hypothetical protein
MVTNPSWGIDAVILRLLIEIGGTKESLDIVDLLPECDKRTHASSASFSWRSGSQFRVLAGSYFAKENQRPAIVLEAPSEIAWHRRTRIPLRSWGRSQKTHTRDHRMRAQQVH